jgi:mercuric ion transport protein
MNTIKASRTLEISSVVDTARPSTPGTGKAGLIGGTLAAIGASLCCLGPLVLVSVGLGGAWVSNLTALAPYRWVFVLAALGFMGYAWYRIYRPQPAAACEPGTLCAAPQTNRVYRVMFWVVSALVLAAIVSPYFAPLFY